MWPRRCESSRRTHAAAEKAASVLLHDPRPRRTALHLGDLARRYFAEKLGKDVPVDTVEPDHIRKWRDTLVDLELAPGTSGLHCVIRMPAIPRLRAGLV